MNCWSNKNYSSRTDRHCIIISLRKNNYLFVDCVTHPYFLLTGFLLWFFFVWLFFSSLRFRSYFVFPVSSRNKHTDAHFVTRNLLLFPSTQRRRRSPEGAQMNLHSCHLLRGITPRTFVCTNIYRKWRSSPWSLLISNNTDIHSTECILLRQ